MQLAVNSRAGIKRTWPLRKRFRLINFQSVYLGFLGEVFAAHSSDYISQSRTQMNISENVRREPRHREAIPQRYIDSHSNGIFAANAVGDARHCGGIAQSGIGD